MMKRRYLKEKMGGGGGFESYNTLTSALYFFAL